MPRFIILGRLRDAYEDGISLALKVPQLGCNKTVGNKRTNDTLTYIRLYDQFGASLIVWDKTTNKMWCAPLKRIKYYQKSFTSAQGMNDYQEWMCRHADTLHKIYKSYDVKR